MGMHVAHVLAYPAPRYGGPPVVVQKYWYHLRRLGVKVTVWGTATVQDLLEMKANGWWTEQEGQDALRMAPARWPKRWYRSPSLVAKMKAEVDSIDLFHLHQLWDYPLYAAARLASRRRKPYIWTPHGTFVASWRYNSPKKRVYLAIMGRRVVAGAACLHAVCPQEAAGFRKLGFRNAVAVIPNGVDPGDFAPLPQPSEADELWPELKGRPVVLYLSRISPEKGLEDLIVAWRSVLHRHPQALLVVAGQGDGKYLQRLRKLCRRASLGHRITFTGHLMRQEKLLMLRRADIFVLPSRTEGHSLALLEAMACGLPVVATKACNFSGIRTSGAGVIVPAGAEGVTQGLNLLLEISSEQREAIGQNGQRLVKEKYTWERAARQMLGVYRSVLEARQRPGFFGSRSACSTSER